MGGNLEIILYRDMGFGYNWSDFANFDIVFFQRPALDVQKRLKLAKYVKDMGLPIWTDFDDNLFDLPPENRLSDDITPEIRRGMIEIMKLSDVVTVSTEKIKDLFTSAKIENIEVVPNALNLDLTAPLMEYNHHVPNTKLEYLWRGSETHQGDLAYFQEPILNVIQKREDVMWSFMGYNPWYITQALPKESWRYTRGEDLFVYFKNLKALKPQVVHFPLVPNSLNICKSNIAWIESTLAGAVCVAPDWDEWKKPGVINYKSPEDYEKILTEPIENAAQLWQQSHDYIMENLTLDHVNQKRLDVLERLLSRRVRKVELPIPTTMIE